MRGEDPLSLDVSQERRTAGAEALRRTAWWGEGPGLAGGNGVGGALGGDGPVGCALVPGVLTQ